MVWFENHTTNRYTELFDETEILFSLIIADQMVQNRAYVKPWLGRFVKGVADRRSLEHSAVGQYLASALEAGADWPLLHANMFGGSPERAAAAAHQVGNAVNEVSRRPWL